MHVVEQVLFLHIVGSHTTCSHTKVHPLQKHSFAGVDIQARDPAGITVLHHAVASCNSVLVEALVKASIKKQGKPLTAEALQALGPGDTTVLHHMARAMLAALAGAQEADARPMDADDESTVDDAGSIVPEPRSDSDVLAGLSAANAAAAASTIEEV